MAFVNDAFTGTDGTNLTAHATDSGHSWAAANGSLEIATNRARPTSNASAVNSVYRSSAVPTSADYSVFGTVSRQVANNSRMGVAGRMATGDASCYAAIWSNNATQIQLLRISSAGGVAATLGTAAKTLAVGASTVLELRMAGTTIKVFDNGAEVISVTDSNISAAGRPGAFGTNPALAAGGIHLDDFSAFNPAQTIAAGLATETNEGQATTAAKRLPAGQATETDEAFGVTRFIIEETGLAEETSAAQALTASKVLAIGQATETDTSAAPGPAKSLAIGLSAESDTAQAPTSGKARKIGLHIDRAGATHLDVDGHSITAGTGATSSTTRFARQVADALGLTESNQAIGGSTASFGGVVYDGWGKVFADDPRAGNSAPYSRLSRMALLMYGINDVGVIGLGFEVFVRHALRTIISRHRAGNVWESTDASVTLSGSWTQVALSAGLRSGSDVHRTSTNGQTVSIAVPSSFAGGTITLGFLTNANQGAVHTVTVDGNAHGSLDTRVNAPNVLACVYRIEGLAAGAHTIGITVSSILNFTWFDYWAVEPDPAEAVVLVKQYTVDDYSVYTIAGYPFEPTDEDVATLNETIDEVAAEFDNVRTVDTDTAIDRNPARLGADGFHPNQLGHDAIAAAVIDALTQAEESDQALTPLALDTDDVPVAQAQEADSALGMTALKTTALGATAETDTASDLVVLRAVDVGLAEDTNTAQALTSAKIQVVGIALEADETFHLPQPQRIAIGLVVETDEALEMDPTGGFLGDEDSAYPGHISPPSYGSAVPTL